jgi:hypothetical protein
MDMMNILSVLIVGAPLVGLPTVAQQAAPPLANDAPLQLVEDNDFAARKDAYLQKSRTEMDEWRSKIHGAGESAESKGHQVSASAKAHFNRTWTATERQWHKLQTESAEGWDRTKNAYERSTADLRAQWHKIHPEDQD